MSDLYSQHDFHRRRLQRREQEAAPGSGWLWIGLVLVAVVALLAIGSGSVPVDAADIGATAAVAPEVPAANE